LKDVYADDFTAGMVNLAGDSWKSGLIHATRHKPERRLEERFRRKR